MAHEGHILGGWFISGEDEYEPSEPRSQTSHRFALLQQFSISKIFQPYAYASPICSQPLLTLSTQPMHYTLYVDCFALHGFDHLKASRIKKPSTPASIPDTRRINFSQA